MLRKEKVKMEKEDYEQKSIFDERRKSNQLDSSLCLRIMI